MLAARSLISIVIATQRTVAARIEVRTIVRKYIVLLVDLLQLFYSRLVFNRMEREYYLAKQATRI